MIKIGNHKLPFELTIVASPTDKEMVIVSAKAPMISVGNVVLFTDSTNRIHSAVSEGELSRFAQIKKEFNICDSSYICNQLISDILSLYTEDIRKELSIDIDKEFNDKLEEIL